MTNEIKKKPIFRNGKLIGFQIYRRGTFFDWMQFSGYEWIEDEKEREAKREKKND